MANSKTDKLPTPPKYPQDDFTNPNFSGKYFDPRQQQLTSLSYSSRPVQNNSYAPKPKYDGKKVAFYFNLQCEVFEFMLHTVTFGNGQLEYSKFIPTYGQVIDATNCVILCLLYNQTSMLSWYLKKENRQYMPELSDSITPSDYQAFLMNDSEVNVYLQNLQRFISKSGEHLTSVQLYFDKKTAQGKELFNLIDNVKKSEYWEKNKTRVLMDMADKYFLWAVEFYNCRRVKLRQYYFEAFKKVTMFIGKSYYCLMRDVYFDFDMAWQKQRHMTAVNLVRYLEETNSIEHIVIEAIKTYLDKHATLQTTIGR